MGICTSVSRGNKTIQAKNLPKKIENEENTNEENKINDREKNENKNNDSLISDKNSKEKLDEKEDYPDIIISYLSKGKTEFEQTFKTKDNVSNLFDILLEKKSKYEEYDLIANDKISLLSKLNEKIGNIFPKTEKGEVTMKYLGLDISNDLKSDYESSHEVIGTPLFNLGENFGVLIYNVRDNTLKAEIIKNKKLSKFNQLSSICNMKNILYISGGDEKKNNSGKTKPINLFCSIDLLNTSKIEDLPELKIARCFHSMIYVPKKYIFIIGGGTPDVELYDVKKKEISFDSKMNEMRNESTLFIMNNTFLYAFCGISPDGSFLTTVEKCNLRQNERSWSFVNYSTADNTLFEECYYIGHFFSDTSLILFASNEGDKNEFSNILFDLEDEENPTISYYEADRIFDVVPEKIFHQIGDNNAVMLPLISSEAKVYKIDEAVKLNVEKFPDAMKDVK